MYVYIDVAAKLGKGWATRRLDGFGVVRLYSMYVSNFLQKKRQKLVINKLTQFRSTYFPIYTNRS